MLVCPECGGTEHGRSTCSRDGNQLIDSGHDDLVGRTVGSYRIARLLGRGGMGAVYLGVHPGIASRVAIKVITPDGSHDGLDVQRFFAEARSVNLIQHENIINVLNLAHLPDGRPYIVMEYINGASLSTWMQSGIGARRMLSMGVEILAALGAAHAKGIVHRDLKPDNVMVTPEGRVKLLDFGIAKLRVEGEPAHQMTATGAVLGTPTYMSPEQALARPADARSDLYSFGILLYQGLAGRVPFKGTSVFEMLQQHVAAPPPPLAAARPDLPPALGAILERTLAKDPAQRPQSARELTNELLALLPLVPDTLPPSLAQGQSQPPATATDFPSFRGSTAFDASSQWPASATTPPPDRSSLLSGSTAFDVSSQWPASAPTPPPDRSSFPVVVPSQPISTTPRYQPLRPGGLIEPERTSTLSRWPWFVVGASGLLLLVFVGLALAAILFFARRPASVEPAPSASKSEPVRPRSSVS